MIENVAPFFADFAIDCTVGGVACRGIFDNAFASSFGITAGTSPLLLVHAADVPDVAQGDAVVLPSGNYTVAGVEPDGTGFALLRLMEA